VAQTAGGVRVEGQGGAVEWAVKMRRLPDDATLLAFLRRGEVDQKLIEELARRVAAFHRSAEANERVASFGRFDAVARNVGDVFDRAAPRAGAATDPKVFDRTRTLAGEALARLRPLIDGRAARGMTRDCHGDLHLDHVYYFPGLAPPADLVVIDCIEFNEAFRFLDPVADMAFAAMDLAFHGRRDLARAFADAYFAAAGDAEGRAMLPLYTAYRAAVRGMVDGMLLGESEVPEAERAAAATRARAHWLLALAELESPGRKPCLVLTAGLPGTGKSTLARGLSGRAGFEVVRGDVVRKELAGLPADQLSPAEVRASLYTPEWTDRTYAECRLRAERMLAEGKRVVVDATFREERYRRTFLDAAVRLGLPAVMLVCEAEPGTIRTRLDARTGDASDADWSVYERIAGRWETAGPDVARVLHTIPSGGSPADALERALEVLRGEGLAEGSA
jgi:aminoglycoside phosphotransferase family enzyme/predicted kinase